MKTLELNQMENYVAGGNVYGCVSAASGGAGVVIGAATVLVASGPIGWGLLGIGLGVVSLVSGLGSSGWGDPCDF